MDTTFSLPLPDDDVPATLEGRALRHAMADLTEREDQLTRAQNEILALKLMRACGMDFCSWLQRELCRARHWTAVDVVEAWRHELHRRDEAVRSARVRAGREAA